MFFYSTFLKYAVGRVEQNKSRLWEVFLRNSRLFRLGKIFKNKEANRIAGRERRQRSFFGVSYYFSGASVRSD